MRILITYILINCEWFIIKLCGIGIILLTDLLCGITSYYFSIDLRFDCIFKSYSELLSKFCDISFQEYVSKGISHPVFYGDLVYNLRRVKDTANFISSGSKIVKRLRRRQYHPLIIERTIGLVLGTYTALYKLKHYTLTNKAVGLYDWPVKPSSEATRSWSSSPLIVSRDSFSHQTWARFQTGGA